MSIDQAPRIQNEATALVTAARDGSQEAFDRLYGLTATELKAWISWRSHRWDMVEECLQHTYITAFRNLHRFRPDGSFLAWLKGIAGNQIKKHLHLQRRQARGIELALVEVQLARQSDGEDLEASISERLASCLERLGERVRNLVWQRYVEDWSVTGMAERDGRSANAVSVSLHRARQVLRKCIGGAGHG